MKILVYIDIEVEMVEIINEEIIEEVVNDLDVVNLDDYKVQAPNILVRDLEQTFIDFIGWKDLMRSSTLIWWISSIAWRPKKKKFKLICLLNQWLSILARRQRRQSFQSTGLFGIEDFKSRLSTRGRVFFFFKWRVLM